MWRLEYLTVALACQSQMLGQVEMRTGYYHFRECARRLSMRFERETGVCVVGRKWSEALGPPLCPSVYPSVLYRRQLIPVYSAPPIASLALRIPTLCDSIRPNPNSQLRRVMDICSSQREHSAAGRPREVVGPK